MYASLLQQSAGEFPCRLNRHEKPKRLIGKRKEPKSFIVLFSACDSLGIAVIEDVQNDDTGSNLIGHAGNSAQSICDQSTTDAISLLGFINSDHRNESCWQHTVFACLFLVGLRHVSDIGCMHIDAIKTDDIAIFVNNYPNAHNIRLTALLCSQFQVVVDLRNATRKSRSIVGLWIERLNCKRWLIFGLTRHSQ